MTLMDTRVDTQPLADLRNLRRTFEVFGWCQGRIEDDEGRMCLVGAMSRVADVMLDCHGGAFTTRFFALSAALNAVRPDPDVLIGSVWNDHHARSVDDVYAIIDAAIAVEESA